MSACHNGCCNGIGLRIAYTFRSSALITLFLFTGFCSILHAQHPESSGPLTSSSIAARPTDELDPSLIVNGVEAEIIAEYRLGEPFNDAMRVVAPDAIYSNVTSFTGAFVPIGGADATTAGTMLRNTRLLADDVQCIAGSPGDRITELRFSVANGNATSLTCRPQLRFFADESGAPGAFLGGYNFNAISFTANNLVLLTFTIPDASQTIVIPASGKVWVGTLFQSNGNVSPAVGGQLNNMGVGLYSPVDLGISANLDFLTTLGGGNGVASPFVSNNPAGTVWIAPYAQPARHGYELVSVRRGCCLGAMTGCVASPVTEKTCLALGGLAWNSAGATCIDGYAATAGLPAAVPDNLPAGGITRSLTITDSFTITDINLRFRMVHSWYGDVIMRLRHVDTDTQITVVPGTSSSSSDFATANWYVLDDQAATTIDAAATTAGGGANAIPSGRYRPMSLLSAFHGQNASGTWEIYIADDASGDTGTLNGWGLEIAGKPSPCTSEPLGACCLATGCQQLTATSCSSQNGTAWYVNVSCEDSDCPPTGRCCSASGSCEMLTEAACLATSGSSWNGALTCATPCEVGACCIGETCTQTTQVGCAGNWTPGVICDGPQTYSAAPAVAIPDNNPTGASNTITVTDSFTVTDANVRLHVTHTWVGDLIVKLSHNGGTPVTIIDRPGYTGTGFGCNQPNYNNLILDDQGGGGAIETLCIANLTSPPNYTPNNPLSAFNGDDASGTWTITVSDNAAGDTGSLVSWSIILDGAPNPCLAATGACCTGTGCVVMTESECDGASGFYYGDDAACPNLDDRDPCTIDSCNPSNGEDVHAPIVCDDNNPCTLDSCDNGNCLNVFQDADGDGVCDANEVCPGHDDNADADGDGTPDGCDGCPNDPAKTAPGICGCGESDADSDGDGTADCNDGCPNDPAKTAPGICGCGESDADSDGDGTADCNDGCPNDPDKIAPGICGCGESDADSDGDGTADCNDGCPNDPDKIGPGQCGCGVSDIDTDGDGTADCNDGCPNDPDKITRGVCGCGVSDVDSDNDGTADCHDGCPLDPDKTAPGQCGCGVADTDTDGDGTADCHDGCPDDPGKTTAGQCGCGIADTDSDADGIADCNDNCLTVPNPGQLDSDQDGVGDVCDNCPFAANPGQEDSNNNNVGDACESDVCPTCPSNTLIVVNSQFNRTITPNTCVSIGEDQVIVELWAANVVPPGATGFQAFLEFEAGKLSYNGADSSYGGSFPLHVQSIATAEVQPGKLNLDGSLNLVSNPPGLTGNILLATLVFDVNGAGWPECTTTAVIFRTFGPFVSELSYQGSPVSNPTTSLTISPDYSRDVTAPAILCAADDASVEPDCTASVSFTSTITDNCCINEGDVSVSAMLLTGNATIGDVTYSTTQISPTEVQVTGSVPVSMLTSCPAMIKVSVMAADCCGNDATICEDTADVNDAMNPVIACPADVTIECSESTAPSNTGMAGATDNCPGTIEITWTDEIIPGACASSKTIERTWTATDACGNTDTCLQTITVQDTTAPSIVCFATGASVNDDCEADVLFTATATDNCCIGVDDVHVSISNPSANALLGAPTINKVQLDGKTVQITGSVPVSALTTCPATIQIEVTGEDCCGHAADLCTATADVNDTIAPEIACPADTTIECGTSTLPAATGQASATDNCAGSVDISYNDVIHPGACTPAYEIVRTWTATDTCNNSSACEQTIQVVDTTAPTISCSITGGNVDAGCEYLVSFSATVEDNCCILEDSVSVAVVLATGNATLGDPDITVTQIDATHVGISGTVLVSALSGCPATVELTVEATDCCGNAATTCSESADVNDVTPPSITCPPSATVECNTSIAPGVTGTPTVSDNCDGDVSVTHSDVTTAGSITSPAGWVFFSQNTASGALVTGPGAPPLGIGSFHMPTGSGNGPGLGGKTWLATSQHSGLLLSALSTFRYSTYVSPSSLAASHLTAAINLYVDLDGNGSRDTTLVFEPVYATLQGPVVQGTWQEWDALTAENGWWYTANFGALTNAQNEFKPLSHYVGLFPNAKIVDWGGAPGMNFVSGQNSGGIWANYDGNVDKVVVNGSTYDFDPATLCSATIKRTWTAQDDCGNSSSCVQTITVQDTTAPIISCPGSITTNADAGGCTAVVDVGTATATDNCDPDPAVTATRSDDQPLDAPYPQGVTTITWKATDACGNMATCNQIVTVNAFNTVKATIVLEGVTVAAPKARCIRFRLDSCGDTISHSITFGDNGGAGGSLRALDVSFDIPCGNWTSLCAKDEQHTLWDATSLIISGTQYEATSVIVLKSGDTDNDGDVDINDVTYFIFTYGGPEGVGGCPWNGTRGADFSLNGNVGTEDFTFLSANWLVATSCSCTTLAGLADPKLAAVAKVSDALIRVSTSKLQPNIAAAADINRDGVVDVKDVELFETARGLPHTLSQRMRAVSPMRPAPNK